VLTILFRYSCCRVHRTEGQMQKTATKILSLHRLLCGLCLVAS